MRKAIILSQAELFTIAAALAAVSESGGGSDENTLAIKIEAQLQSDEYQGEHLASRAASYIHAAHREFEREFA
jgi:hypothetical protein